MKQIAKKHQIEKILFSNEVPLTKQMFKNISRLYFNF